jgi:hypothetical protein
MLYAFDSGAFCLQVIPPEGKMLQRGMRKSGTRFAARIPRSAFGEDHVHDIDVD